MCSSVRSLWLPVWTALLWLASPASAVTVDWVAVGNPGNACNPQTSTPPGCFGAVAQTYQISKFDVTNAQYAEFLNAKAGALDPLALYNTNMAPAAGLNGGITHSGSVYTAVSGRENLPVNWVSFYDTLRFANWMNNGQGAGDTETGAYTLLGGTAAPTNGPIVTRNPGATIVLTSQDEWYKAAYHDALGLLATDYFAYPAGSNTQTGCTATGATANTANCNWPLTVGTPGDLTKVGSYTGSASPYGTFDQGGNVFQWTEALNGTNRVLRGGSFISPAAQLAAASQSAGNPADAFKDVGFRVAMIPEPGTGLLVMAGVLGLAGWRRRRASTQLEATQSGREN
jgi:formylglycine-generating enzyme required for sulfatase activity